MKRVVLLLILLGLAMPARAGGMQEETLTLYIADELVTVTTGSKLRIVNWAGFEIIGVLVTATVDALELRTDRDEFRRISGRVIVRLEVLEGPTPQRRKRTAEPVDTAELYAADRLAPHARNPDASVPLRNLKKKPSQLRKPRTGPARSRRVELIRESWLQRRTRYLGFMIGAMESPRWADLRRRIRGFEYESEFQWLQWYREDRRNEGVHDSWLFRQRLAVGLSNWVGFWFESSFYWSSFEQQLHQDLGQPRTGYRREIDDLGSYSWGVQHGFLLYKQREYWLGMIASMAFQLGLGGSNWEDDDAFHPTFHDVEDDEYDGARRASGARLGFESGLYVRPNVAVSLNMRHLSVQVEGGLCYNPLQYSGFQTVGCVGFGAAGRMPFPSIYSELSLLAEASLAAGEDENSLVSVNLMLDMQLPVVRVGLGYRRLVLANGYWGAYAEGRDNEYPHVLVFRVGLRFDPWARNRRDP